MKRLNFCAVIAFFVATASLPVFAKVASKYETVDISCVNYCFNILNGISDSEIVYGHAYERNSETYGIFRQNIYTGKTEFTDQFRIPNDINNNGIVAGVYSTRNGSDQYCVWNADGTITDLPHVSNNIWPSILINDSNRVLIQNENIWTPGSNDYVEAYKPTSGYFWKVTDINNSGYYLGDCVGIKTGTFGGYEELSEFLYAVWSENGDCYQIDRPSDCSDLVCSYINDSNQVTGTVNKDGKYHVFIWDKDSGVTDVTPIANGNFYCDAINNMGQILIEGYYTQGDTAVGVHYIWDKDDGLVSVQDMIDPNSGWQLENFRGINSDGWIVSSAYNSITRVSRDILLRPVTTPEPGSLLALLTGIIGLLGFRRTRSSK